jgi:hypothetical protein
VHTLRDRERAAADSLRVAEEEFMYLEAHTEMRDVRRAAACGALMRGDASDAVVQLRGTGGSRLRPRERVFNRLLSLAVWLARRRFARLSLALVSTIELSTRREGDLFSQRDAADQDRNSERLSTSGES